MLRNSMEGIEKGSVETNPFCELPESNYMYFGIAQRYNNKYFLGYRGCFFLKLFTYEG